MVEPTEELQALNLRWAWEVPPEGLSACRWAGMGGCQASMGQAGMGLKATATITNTKCKEKQLSLAIGTFPASF